MHMPMIVDGRDVVARAVRAMDWRPKDHGGRTFYGLGDGGRTPNAPHPFELVKVKSRDGEHVYTVWRADCSALAAYSVGKPRELPDFNRGGSVSGYINTDSILEDAMGIPYGGRPVGLRRAPQAELFRHIASHSDVEMAEPVQEGDLLVRPSLRNADGSRKRPGHVQVVSYVPTGIPQMSKLWWKAMKVIHCAGSNAGNSVAQTAPGLAMEESGHFVRYIGG